MDVSKMTDEQLRAESQDLWAQRQALKARQMAITAELDRRAVLAKLGDLSDGEISALGQVLQARGIESAEALGTPGQ